MAVDRVVIVGAGQGGLQAAISLRQDGFDGDVTLIGAEPGLPYQRPPLSKAYLKTGEAQGLQLRPAAFFVDQRITYLDSLRVDVIDREARVVRAGAREFAYDHLILATGTHNFRPPIPGLEHALDLRTLEDAGRLRAALGRPLHLAIIGGGFIGLETAAVARALGHDVTVAEAAPRLMGRAVSAELSARYLQHHEEMGTRILLGAPVASVSKGSVTLADGREIAADCVLLAAGVRPNVALAEAAGLDTQNGVVTDALLQTSDPAISALGDCAAFPDPVSGRHIRLESVQAATDHARAIARRIAKGEKVPYDAVPWFWSDQGDWKLQIAGLAGPEDAAIPVGEGAIFRFRGDTLTAVETVNDARTHMKARRAFAGTLPTRSELESNGFELLPSR